MSALAEALNRRVYTGREGQTDRPACGPLARDCLQQAAETTGGVHGWTVYRCVRCGDEEWL